MDTPERQSSLRQNDVGEGRRVLYIDDDEALILLVERMLKKRGYVVTGFSEAEEALETLRAKPMAFDLVVTDYNMPGMSGIDVATLVKGIRADLPVAIASGFITDEMRAEALSIGVKELIFKPNAIEEYCAAVDRFALYRE
jgi:DNA-binding NtrC family response regulator